MSASAHSVTLYFGQPEFVTGSYGFVPADGYPQPAGGVDETVILGLWGVPEIDWVTPGIDIWEVIGLNIVTSGDVTVDSIDMNNIQLDEFSGAHRWRPDSDLGGTDGTLNLIGRDPGGLGGFLPAALGGAPCDLFSYFDGDLGSGFARYWLGNVTLTSHGSPGDVFLQIGPGGLARRGGDVGMDLVCFGLDDDAPLLGDQFGATTPTPEFRFIPEPAGVFLMSLAALLSSRRYVVEGDDTMAARLAQSL